MYTDVGQVLVRFFVLVDNAKYTCPDADLKPKSTGFKNVKIGAVCNMTFEVSCAIVSLMRLCLTTTLKWEMRKNHSGDLGVRAEKIKGPYRTRRRHLRKNEAVETLSLDGYEVQITILTSCI
jgi:hypothetical protein